MPKKKKSKKTKKTMKKITAKIKGSSLDSLEKLLLLSDSINNNIIKAVKKTVRRITKSKKVRGLKKKIRKLTPTKRKIFKKRLNKKRTKNKIKKR